MRCSQVWEIEQVRTVACPGNQQEAGRVLVCVRLNISYDQTVSKAGRGVGKKPSLQPGSGLQARQGSHQGTVSSTGDMASGPCLPVSCPPRAALLEVQCGSALLGPFDVVSCVPLSRSGLFLESPRIFN